jgi:hypothetical protein
MFKIKVTMRDGMVHEFQDSDRPGGSYRGSVRYEGDWVVVRDVWGEETAFPADLVERVDKPSGLR